MNGEPNLEEASGGNSIRTGGPYSWEALAAPGLLLACGLLVLAWIFYFGPTPSGLRQCDEAIKAQLKAPATYRRISGDGSYGIFNITYDAENSFGVPIRSKGMCFVNDGKASWLEDSLR
jgi:hypothetical protein